MTSLYELEPEAQNDVFEIWSHIALDSVDLADRIEGEFHELFASLGRMPRKGHRRRDLTKRPVLFCSLYSFVVAYQPDVSDPHHGVASGQARREERSQTTTLNY